MDKMELRKKALMLSRDKLERKPMDMNRDPLEMMGEDDEQESGENEMISMMVSPKEKMVLEQMRKRKKPMSEEVSDEEMMA